MQFIRNTKMITLKININIAIKNKKLYLEDYVYIKRDIKMSDNISIIIPVYNEEKELKKHT